MGRWFVPTQESTQKIRVPLEILGHTVSLPSSFLQHVSCLSSLEVSCKLRDVGKVVSDTQESDWKSGRRNQNKQLDVGRNVEYKVGNDAATSLERSFSRSDDALKHTIT